MIYSYNFFLLVVGKSRRRPIKGEKMVKRAEDGENSKKRGERERERNVKEGEREGIAGKGK